MRKFIKNKKIGIIVLKKLYDRKKYYKIAKSFKLLKIKKFISYT